MTINVLANNLFKNAALKRKKIIQLSFFFKKKQLILDTDEKDEHYSIE